MSRIALLLLLGQGCGGSPDGALDPGTYFGDEGRRIDFVAAPDPDAPTVQLEGNDPPLQLRIGQDEWEFRLGQRWADATFVAVYFLDRDDGLWVDDVQLLPAEPAIGASCDGCEVVEAGETETTYGRFLDTLTVEIDDGDFAGQAAFARDVGPVLFERDGRTWTAAYYE